MKQIHGTNLGNWLVLEKWMSPAIFADTGAEDETWLARKLPADEFAERLKQHRDTYVTEKDFQFIAESGLDTVRLPVTYGVFGDRPPLTGAIEYVDKALDWAEKYGLKVLLDLHTEDATSAGPECITLEGHDSTTLQGYRHVVKELVLLQRLSLCSKHAHKKG